MKGSAIVAMIGVFIDPFVVLTVTALVVISTLYAGNGVLAGGATEGGTRPIWHGLLSARFSGKRAVISFD